MHSLFACIASLAPLLAVGTIVAAASHDDAHLHASLLAEQTALVPGRTMLLGLRLEHAPHWHTYWRNPGDSGLPTRLQWTLPRGFRTGAIRWPIPQRLDQGDIHDFGYTGDTLLPIPLQVPDDAQPGTIAHLEVEAKWLACREQCIPGKARLALDLPIHESAAHGRRAAALFKRAQAMQPRDVDWSGTAHLHGDRVDVSLTGSGVPSGAMLDAFAQTPQVLANAPPRIARHGERIELHFARNDYYVSAPSNLVLILTAKDGRRVRAYRISVPFDASDKPTPST